MERTVFMQDNTPEIKQDLGLPPLQELKRYWSIVLKSKWYMISFTVFVVAAASLYTLRLPKIYEATSTILVELQEDAILNNVSQVHQLGTIPYLNEEYLATQENLIRSRKLAEKVVEKLGLDHDIKFLGLENVEDPEILDEMIKKIDPADKLVKSLNVSITPKTYVMVISLRHEDPTLAALLANTYAETFIEMNLDRKLESTYNAIQWLNKQARDLSKELSDSEQLLNDFKRQNDIITTTMEDKISITSQKLSTLGTSLSDARNKRLLFESEWNQLKDIDPEKDFEKLSAPILLRNSLLSELYKDFSASQAELGKNLKKYTPEHHVIKELNGQLEIIKSNIILEINRSKESAKRAYLAALEIENKVNDEMNYEKGKALELHGREVEYNMLARKRETVKQLYELVMRRLKETDLTRMFKSNNIHMLDAAIVPTKPVLPNVKQNIVAALIIGLLGGIFIAFLIDYMDNTIKSEEDIEGLLGIPLLGVIPYVKQEFGKEADRRGVAFHAYNNPKSSLAESFRTIRTNIHFTHPDKEIHRLLITSANPKEGKTTISSTLAMSFAQAGWKTVIIDVDLRRPSANKVFNVEKGRGVTDVIVGDIKWQDVVLHTEVPGLDFILAGTSTPSSTELVGSENFANMIDDISKYYDKIVIDSPPVGAVSDALILSSLTDGVILVAKFGSTTKDRLKFSKRSLSDVKANLLGCVINELDPSKKRYGYYYYHYYYNRYGYHYGYGQSGYYGSYFEKDKKKGKNKSGGNGRPKDSASGSAPDSGSDDNAGA